MFGMGFFEILVILVIAVIFLGPEKLPKAIVDIAKFLRVVKKSLEDAKESLDKEINISKIKEEALAYKASFEEGTKQIEHDLKLEQLSLNNLDNILEDTSAENTDKKTTTTNEATKNSPTPQNTQNITQKTNISLDFKTPTKETIPQPPQPKEKQQDTVGQKEAL